MVTDIEQVLLLINKGEPVTEASLKDLCEKIDEQTDNETKVTIDLALQTQKLLKQLKELQNISASSIGKDDQQIQINSLVEEKITVFKNDIENKINKINTLEEQELKAKTQINLLSNEIKLKAAKIKELEAKVGEIKDNESNMSLKELQTQNGNLKSKLANELKKFEDLKKEYDNMDNT